MKKNEIKKAIREIEKKLKINKGFSMEEVCHICRKKQEVNEPYVVYSKNNLALCPKCEGSKDIKTSFDNGRLWGMWEILKKLEGEKND